MTKNANPGPPILSAVNPVSADHKRSATAIVYCEANFGAIDGKTANGLVRHSERYEILSVIDSEKAGLDAGMVLDGEPNGIPICRDLAQSLEMPGVNLTADIAVALEQGLHHRTAQCHRVFVPSFERRRCDVAAAEDRLAGLGDLDLHMLAASHPMV